MRILLIEDNPGDIRLLQEYLKEGSAAGGFQITQAGRLSTGLARLAEARFDAVLLDLSLPDSQGLDTLVRLHGAAKDVPIVVLTGIEDEALGVKLVQAGAQDYLVKGSVTGPLLMRSLRYAAERQRAEGELQQARMQLIQAQKMEAIGHLAGGIAHDFNNILTAILGNAEIACTKLATDHPSRPNLTGILEAGSRASRLVQQILTFTHQQAHSRIVQVLAPVVYEALALLRATLPAGIELTVTEDAATPPVLADATQLHQVVMNLCTNAWHALKNQPGSIAVDLAPVTLIQALHTLATTLPPGRYTCLSIRDTGCGMDPDTVARIFNPFFTTKPVGQGTGLGLSVVHGIVQGHEGAIVVDSHPGRGTAFHLYFPAAEAPAQASLPVGTAPVQIQKRCCHLLYLDDEEILVELVRATFEPLGYRVTGYTKAAEALAAVCADPASFDVVVTDYNMPGMSGLEVARALTHIRADLPVVLVSGYLSQTVHQSALTADIKEIVYKPAMLQQLGDIIGRLLDTPQYT